MSYVERDGIWHIVARSDDAEAVTGLQPADRPDVSVGAPAKSAVQPLQGGLTSRQRSRGAPWARGPNKERLEGRGSRPQDALLELTVELKS